MTNPTFSLGIYTFASLSTFLQNQPLRFVGLGPTGDINRDWPWTYLGVYVQDNYHVTPRLTVNGGLRYEGMTMPEDTGGRDSALVNLTDAAATVGPLYDSPSRFNLSPRVGAAWDVLGDGSTSVRGGYGLYYNTSNQQNLIVTVTNPPATPRFVIANPTFPNPPFERGVGNTIRPVQNDIEMPRLHMWNVSMQRSLPANLVATIGYAGSRGKHLFRNTVAPSRGMTVKIRARRPHARTTPGRCAMHPVLKETGVPSRFLYGVFVKRYWIPSLVPPPQPERAAYPRIQRPLCPECRSRRTICVDRVLPTLEKLYCPDCGHLWKRELLREVPTLDRDS